MARVSNVFSFRGLILPWVGREAGFDHETVAHRRLYRPRAALEQMGPGSISVTYQVPMDDGATLGFWKGRKLYSEDLPKLWRHMWDRSPGTLYDAVWRDTAQAVPAGPYREQAGRSRSGVLASLSFLLDDVDDEEAFPAAGLESLAAENQAVVALAEPLELPADAPDPQALGNPLAIAQGYVAQGEAYAEQVAAQVDGYASQLQGFAELLEKASDPLAWQVLPRVNALRQRAESAARSLGGAGANGVGYIVRADMTLSSLAREVGADRDLLLRLNADLAAAGYVKAGTEIQLPGV